jgi:hypothetical protein
MQDFQWVVVGESYDLLFCHEFYPTTAMKTKQKRVPRSCYP